MIFNHLRPIFENRYGVAGCVDIFLTRAPFEIEMKIELCEHFALLLLLLFLQNSLGLFLYMTPSQTVTSFIAGGGMFRSGSVKFNLHNSLLTLVLVCDDNLSIYHPYIGVSYKGKVGKSNQSSYKQSFLNYIGNLCIGIY